MKKRNEEVLRKSPDFRAELIEKIKGNSKLNLACYHSILQGLIRLGVQGVKKLKKGEVKKQINRSADAKFSIHVKQQLGEKVKHNFLNLKEKRKTSRLSSRREEFAQNES